MTVLDARLQDHLSKIARELDAAAHFISEVPTTGAELELWDWNIRRLARLLDDRATHLEHWFVCGGRHHA